MTTEGPKLYTQKPKKSQLKQVQGSQKTKDFYSPPSSSAAEKMGSQSHSSAPPPPPPPPKESFARRYKFLWPLLLTVNLAVGAYIFMRTKKKDTSPEEQAAENSPSTQESPTTTITSLVAAYPIPSLSVLEPMKTREQIPKYQQLELFKWMLEEKRKVKPKDHEERKRVDEEKAILKEFIRAKSIPSV